MKWWPFHRRRRQPSNGEAARTAAEARREAEAAVRAAQARDPEVAQVVDEFTVQFEAAMTRRHL